MTTAATTSDEEPAPGPPMRTIAVRVEDSVIQRIQRICVGYGYRDGKPIQASEATRRLLLKGIEGAEKELAAYLPAAAAATPAEPAKKPRAKKNGLAAALAAGKGG